MAGDENPEIIFTVLRPLENPAPTRNQMPKTSWSVLGAPYRRLLQSAGATEGLLFLRGRSPFLKFWTSTGFSLCSSSYPTYYLQTNIPVPVRVSWPSFLSFSSRSPCRGSDVRVVGKPPSTRGVGQSRPRTPV